MATIYIDSHSSYNIYIGNYSYLVSDSDLDLHACFDLIIYNIINLLIYINKFKTNFINLPLFKTFIVTITSEALKVNNVIIINLVANITTKLFV